MVVALIACGLCEVGSYAVGRFNSLPFPFIALATVSVGGMSALVLVALKVGALSYGGGFVIVPLMQQDAVSVHHWMTDAEFLNAVALGQVTPGPVVLTIAVVGFAAHGFLGAVVATVVAFGPSFFFVIAGGAHFDKFRSAGRPAEFLRGAGPAAIGAILGAAVPLALALDETWQFGILVGACLWVVVFKRNTTIAIAAAGVVGLVAVALGAPLP